MNEYIGLKIFSIVALFLAIAGMPFYAFYQLLRWGLCGILIFLAYSRYKIKDEVDIWVILTGIFVIVFNPIMPFFFGRELWMLFDIATIGYLFVLLRIDHKNI